MKKILFVGALVVSLITGSEYSLCLSKEPETPKENRQIDILVSKLNTEEVTGEDGQKYHKLAIPESQFSTDEEGSPQLPYIRKLVEIPAQASDIKIKALPKSEPVEYSGFLVYPSPRKVVKEDSEGFKYVEEEFYLNKDSYQNNCFMPKELAGIKKDGFFRSTRILEVDIYPVRYNPRQKLLMLHNAIEINISYRIDEKLPKPKDNMKYFKDFKEKLFLNKAIDWFKEIMPWSVQTAEAAEGSVNYLTAGDLRNVANNIDYLIVTYSDCYNSAQLTELAVYRANYNSFNIGIAKVEDIYLEFPNGSGHDYSIKDFVQYAYDNWQTAPSYLLLLGDVTIKVPEVGYVELVPTHFDANCGADNDDWFGYVAGNDTWADLAIGRLSVQRPEQITYIKDKIYAYEQNAIMPGDYHEQAVYVEGDYAINKRIRDRLPLLGYAVSEFCGPIPYTAYDVRNAFGSNFVYVIAHGSQYGWGIGYPYPSSEIFSFDDIDALGNTNKYPIVMAISCSTADISCEYPTECFAEAMVNAQEKGAVAYYGATVTIFYNSIPDDTLDEIFDNFEYDLGQAVLLAEIKGGTEYARQQILIGDPALHSFGYRISPAQPDLTLSQNDISYDGRAKNLSVKITNLSNADAIDVNVQVLLYETPEISHIFADFTIPFIGAKSEVETCLTVPPPLEGKYPVVAKIDPENTIDESFELNNQNGRILNTIDYSVVTVLDENSQPISGTSVCAYDIDNVFLTASTTDGQGKARLYIKQGLQVYFKAGFSILPPVYSYIYSDIVTAPADVTINKPNPQPEQLSTLTVLNPEGLVESYRCSAYDLKERLLGSVWKYLPAPEDAFDFYVKEGTQFYFVVGWGGAGGGMGGSKIYSDILTAPADATLDVSNGIWPPSASFTAYPTNGLAPLTVNFTDTSTDSDGYIVSWNWNFGDGGASTTQSPSHVYTTAGSYTVALTVTDNDGAAGEASTIISVSAADTTPPTGTISINAGAVYTTSASVTLSLLATDTGSGMGLGAQMQFSNDGTSWSTPEAYATTKSWALTSGDGTKTVYAKFKDAAGNWSSAVSDTITLDAMSPTGTISINSGAVYTTSASVTLSLLATDAGSGMGSGAEMQFSNDGTSWSTAEAYAATKSWTLTSGNGTKTVYVKFKDAAGNWSAAVSDTIVLDATQPTGTISINSGAVYTTSTSVTLNLFATDTGSGMGSGAQMQFSNDGLLWSVPGTYATTKSWTLTTGNGTKTVYAKFMDAAGNWSSAVSDTIVLDATQPTGTISINSGAVYTISTFVTLNLSATDTGSGMGSGAQMQFSNDGTSWSTAEAYAATKSWALTSGDGAKTVYAKFKDAAGNWSSAVSDTITLDATSPTGTISINSGAVYTTSASVILSLLATDAGSGMGLGAEMQFSNDGTSWSTAETYVTTKSWTLTTGDGTKTVYAKFKDAAGNWSSAVSDTIVLDTTPPVIPTVTDDGTYTQSRTQLRAAWSSKDPESGIAEYQYAIGTSKGATDVVNWTSTGTAVSVTKTGLSLKVKKTYYFSVKAKNGGGLWSGIGYSDGITVTP